MVLCRTTNTDFKTKQNKNSFFRIENLKTFYRLKMSRLHRMLLVKTFLVLGLVLDTQNIFAELNSAAHLT